MRLCVLPLLILMLAGAARSASPASTNDVERSFAAAESLMQDGKMAEAAQALERIVRAHPDFAEEYFALGVFLCPTRETGGGGHGRCVRI